MKHATFLLLLFTLTALFTACKKEDQPAAPTPIKSSSKEIVSPPTVSGVSSSSANYDNTTQTYTVTVPAGTDVKALRLTIPVSASATITPDPTVARDYTNPVSFTVTAEDKTTQVYTVKVNVQATPKSSEKQITAFSFAALNPVVSASIDQASRKITATVPADADLTKLVPTITVTAKATVSPASGVAQNFSSPLSYTVTAEDGSRQVYEVSVGKAAIVTSNVACLLTREEYTSTESSYIREYTHDQKGRIINIKQTGKSSGSNESFEYDNDGNVSRVYTPGSSTGDIRFTYQNGKVVKMVITSGTKVIDFIEAGYIKFNDNNEMIELSEYANGFIDNKFEYSGGNLVKYTSYDEDKKQWNTYDISYDTKNNPTMASKPPKILSFRFLSYGFSIFGANNMNGFKLNGSSLQGVTQYTYNKNNFPTESNATDSNGKPVTSKYTYTNCQ
jgi:hypothetical protein